MLKAFRCLIDVVEEKSLWCEWKAEVEDESGKRNEASPS